MGLLVTLFLINVNIYGTIEAPPGRGLSNVEIWMAGMQLIIILAIFEYGFILAITKIRNLALNYNKLHDFIVKLEKNQTRERLDFITLCLSGFTFVTFVCSYWFINNI